MESFTKFFVEYEKIFGGLASIAAVLALFGGFITWFFGLWGNRKPKPTKVAKSGGVIVEGSVHGDITTNPPSKKGKK